MHKPKITVKLSGPDVAKFCVFKDRDGNCRLQVYDGTKVTPDILIQSLMTKEEAQRLIDALRSVMMEM